MTEKDRFLGEASFGKEGSFVGSNPTPHFSTNPPHFLRLLTFSEDFDPIHVGDILESCLYELA